jgi:hypothetical protein
MTTRKITFRVPEALWASFTEQTKRAFINRAPFLDHMMSIELDFVTADLAEFKLSPKARRHISGALSKAGAKPVNIEIRRETAEALDEVVERHGLVRDALLCRLLVFLRGSDALFKYMEIPSESGESVKRNQLVFNMPASPMKAIEQVYTDPMYYIRTNLEARWGCGIYDFDLPSSLNWAACKLEDINVPGTKDNKTFERMVADFAAEEASALSVSKDSSIGRSA